MSILKNDQISFLNRYKKECQGCKIVRFMLYFEDVTPPRLNGRSF